MLCPRRLITASEAAQAYYAGLDQGGARVDFRRDDGASRQELVVVAEFGAWLQHLPIWWDRNLYTAVPEDIVSYVESHWVHHHGRTYVGDASEPVASASGAKHVLLDLEHYFAALGRSGDWNVSLLSGNPCRSFVVKQWLRGYKRFQRVAGVRHPRHRGARWYDDFPRCQGGGACPSAGQRAASH
jgi:hypothetical protein